MRPEPMYEHIASVYWEDENSNEHSGAVLCMTCPSDLPISGFLLTLYCYLHFKENKDLEDKEKWILSFFISRNLESFAIQYLI